MEERYLHKPALLDEVIDFLDPCPGNVIIDATIGGAGHAEEILHRILPGGILIGIDKDSESLQLAGQRLETFKGSFKLINSDFRHLREILADINIKGVDGILFDLGISSIQLETPDRGFSIKNNGPLDMRMDKNQVLTAGYLVNTLSESELSHLIRDFGEERFHRRIARQVVNAREKKKIQTTSELAQIISDSMPYSNRRQRIHPATRTFQALRIRVNDELSSIDHALRELPLILNKAGRVCVISFHSLEDRIVKNCFKEFKAKKIFCILTKKPVRVKEEEAFVNPRARSAKLRAAEKIS